MYTFTKKKEFDKSVAACLLLALAISYNAFLAIINAHIFRLSPSIVMLTELIILMIASLLIINNSRNIPRMTWHLSFVYFIILISLWGALFNSGIYFKGIRDMLLMPIFFILGSYIEEKNLKKLVRWITLVVFAIMILEGWFTSIYVSIFAPSKYFAQTRGIEEFSLDSSGLFRNSLGFAGRFNLGIFNTHRLSSIFLEQVSLANFSMALGLFTLALWQKLSKLDRTILVVTITMILLTNNTRTGLIINICFVFGYFIFPKIPRILQISVIPLILLITIPSFYEMDSVPSGDNFAGRIAGTVHFLINISLKDFFVGNYSYIAHTSDSGYAYLIYALTFFGMIAYWLYVSTVVPYYTDSTKRLNNGITLFIAANLMIGAGIFTIKTAALIWLLAGYLTKETEIEIKRSRLNA